MSVNILCAAFRRVAISKQTGVCAKCISTQQSRVPPNLPVVFATNSVENTQKPSNDVNIRFSPRAINIGVELPVNNGIITNIIDLPVSKIPSFEEPANRKPVQSDLPGIEKSLELPSVENIVEKLAIRMLVIRKKKMKKHKRKKLRKKMKVQWTKVRERRNMARERAFQAEMIGKIQEAQKFDAKTYVEERLKLYDKKFIPKTWRGEILPEAMILKFMAEVKAKKQAKRNKPRVSLDDSEK